MGLALVVVFGLIITLVVWAPWSTTDDVALAQAPAQPASASVVSLNATTAQLTWAGSDGDTPVEGYVIVRDGVEIASVDGSTLLYVDSGLVPGDSHDYRVLAEANGQRSTPSAFVTVTMPAPSPEGLHVTDRGTGSMTLAWDPPQGTPTPDRYAIVDLRTGDVLMTVEGSLSDVEVTGLEPGSQYSFQVVAMWGSNQSSPSVEAEASTRVPSVKAARLAGSMPLKIKVASSPGGSLKRGQSWTDSWSFKPVCDSGSCSTVLKGDITPPGTATHSFKVTLSKHGALYTGQTKAHITHCGMAPVQKNVRNTVAVRIRVMSGHVVNGEWRADRWEGTLRLRSPYTSAGMYYCPSQTVPMNLTGR